MNKNEFKKELHECAKNRGFEWHNRNYYNNSQNVITVINIQKSNFSDSYYINYGFCIKDIHKELNYPKIRECDIMGRFANGEKKDVFDLCILDVNELKVCIEDNFEKVIVPVMNEGIEKYFELYPQAICAAKLTLKRYLGKEK